MKRIIPVLIAVLLSGCSENNSGDYDLWVLHTNDSHSHRLGLPNCEYQGQTSDGTVGGAARLATLIDQERAAHDELLLFSAGDFTMRNCLIMPVASAKTVFGNKAQSLRKSPSGIRR